MKKFKGLKITVIVLLIILLSMVSFIGIYVQDKNQVKNILPEYILSRDLKGHRRIELKVNDEVKETKKYDADNNLITDDTTEVARTEEIKVNSEEILTKENYEASKKVIEKRLEEMQVNNYDIRQNLENGTIILELPEDDNTDRIVGQLSLQGKFEIIDKDTNEVLMTNDDLKSVQSRYGTTSSGTTSIVLNIQFNKEGTEKFKNITNTYVQTTKTVEQEEGEEAKEETETKEISIKIDDTTLLSTYFSEQVTNGLLQLSVGSSTNSTTEELQEYAKEATSMAALLDSGKMPIVYEVEQNKYILSEVTQDVIEKVIVVSIIVLTLAIIYLIIKYKGKGILAGISIIGYVALLLLAIRYANVEVSIAGIIEILFSTLINYMLVVSMLKEEKINNAIKKYSLILIPTVVIAIAFTFANIAVGIVLFWGIVIAMLYNISVTNLLLRD
mgnify:FL=1